MLTRGMEDADDEDYIFVGTPLQEEVETKFGQRSKAVKDSTQTRALPLHKQVHSLFPFVKWRASINRRNAAAAC